MSKKSTLFWLSDNNNDKSERILQQDIMIRESYIKLKDEILKTDKSNYIILGNKLYIYSYLIKRDKNVIYIYTVLI